MKIILYNPIFTKYYFREIYNIFEKTSSSTWFKELHNKLQKINKMNIDKRIQDSLNNIKELEDHISTLNNTNAEVYYLDLLNYIVYNIDYLICKHFEAKKIKIVDEQEEKYLKKFNSVLEKNTTIEIEDNYLENIFESIKNKKFIETNQIITFLDMYIQKLKKYKKLYNSNFSEGLEKLKNNYIENNYLHILFRNDELDQILDFDIINNNLKLIKNDLNCEDQNDITSQIENILKSLKC